MKCEHCQKHPATVHVTEIRPANPGPADPGPADAGQAAHPIHGELSGELREQHLCQVCAQRMHLTSAPIHKTAANILKLLHSSAQRKHLETTVVCPDCGMTLLEFREKGRLGCPNDYQVFGPHARDLLERIHGSTQHVGNAPAGIDTEVMERRRRALELEKELEHAIRKEAYEQAARLRDELKSLQKR
jgi:protein arginine kinase activator